MADEKAKLNKNENIDGLDFDDLERALQDDDLQKELDEQLAEWAALEEEQEKIGDPEVLGDVVLNTIWEQFINQVAVRAGEDFVKENGDKRLDLSKDSHIQTTENFAEGKIATHNTDIDYQKRYDEWIDNFQKQEDGTIKTTIDTKTGEEQAALKKHARVDFDKDRPQGSKIVHKDHTIPAAEIIRDPEAAAHMTREEQVAFANSEKNLGDLDAEANMSKGDSKMEDWLASERNGQKPAERFNIDEDELRQRDKEAREEYERQKKEMEARSVASGKKSRKAEALRVGKKAARAIIMNLLADLVKKIVRALISWFRSTGRKLSSLLKSIKDNIVVFVRDLKNTVVNVSDTAVTVIATSILGPVVSTIKKAWMFIKQGWKSLKESIAYIRNPKNRNKPIGIMMMEVGKIVTAGFVAAGAIVLGDVIEKGLSMIPLFAVEIPMFGSLANIIGIFMGAVIAGVIGAIALNLINRAIAKKKKQELTADKIDKGNEVLATLTKINKVQGQHFQIVKSGVAETIYDRHTAAGEEMRKTLKHVEDMTVADHTEDFSSMDKSLDALLDE